MGSYSMISEFKFVVLKASRVMITQGRFQYVHLCKFSGHKGWVYHTILIIMASFIMEAQMFPWQLCSFGCCLMCMFVAVLCWLYARWSIYDFSALSMYLWSGIKICTHAIWYLHTHTHSTCTWFYYTLSLYYVVLENSGWRSCRIWGKERLF